MTDFQDLLTANQAYATTFDLQHLRGAAARGVAIVTCMDARIDPLAVFGLRVGDAKVIRNPGGRVTPVAMEALVLATHLLDVDRVLIVEHTRCAVASHTEDQLRSRVAESAGRDATDQPFHVIGDQATALASDVAAVRAHPLIPEGILVGGFLYDVETGRVDQLC